MSETKLSAPQYSPEQLEFATTIEAFLEEQHPLAFVRQRMVGGPSFDTTLWKRSATELRLLGLGLPEKLGGEGYGFAELSLVLTAAGKANVSWPYLSTVVLSGYGLLLSGDQSAMERWLPSIASGEALAAFCVGDDLGGDDVSARKIDGARWAIDGSKRFVLDGSLADVVFVVATTPDGPTLFEVRPDGAQIRRTEHSVLDPSRDLATIEFRETVATAVGGVGGGDQILAELRLLAVAALVCEAAGGTAVTLDRSVQYAKDRLQFGRPIGSFQSIKHRCADMYIRADCSACFAESVALAVDEALASPNPSLEPIRVSIATAAAYCSEAFVRNANDMIQIHGGIGYTWEHDAHLYLRRAVSSARLFGRPDRHIGYLSEQIASRGLHLGRGDDGLEAAFPGSLRAQEEATR